MQKRIPCPDCGGTGLSNEHFVAHQIQDKDGNWVKCPFCTMCFGHGTIVVIPDPRREAPR